ncbi:MAG: aspartate kinase, monofunctional class [Anaerolineaceae bacterium]|nr:aspartate kinase, monofunctional class [Anaerolineaceae bacterium]
MEKKNILVMKFGGTSVGSAEAIQQAVSIIREECQNWKYVVVVVSAMTKVTDALIKSARQAVFQDEHTFGVVISDLKKRHYDVVTSLLKDGEEKKLVLRDIDRFLEELVSYCRSIHIMGEVTARGMDTITSLGERMNARVIAALLNQIGVRSQAVDASHLIVTDATFQNAVPLMDKTRKKSRKLLLPLLESGMTPIVTGFIGATEEGFITTLGRGGSDFTSSILGKCLDADEVWTLTDVNGVLSADPRIVPNARIIPEISYNEVGEMAYFGAKVLHPKTIRPVIEANIPLRVKNTFNPSNPGTLICNQPTIVGEMITAITTIKDLSMITVEGRGMLGVPGIAARTFSAVARTGASVLMISQSSSEQSICFVIPKEDTDQVIRSLEEEMELELMRRDIDSIWAENNIVILTAIGARLRHTPGVSAKVFGALGKAEINVIAVAQGSSKYSISLVIKEEDANEAVRRVHQDVIEGERNHE